MSAALLASRTRLCDLRSNLYYYLLSFIGSVSPSLHRYLTHLKPGLKQVHWVIKFSS